MSKARNLSVVPNQTLGMKNRIINGDMRINQRGATVTSSTYIVDRWRTWFDQSYSLAQSTDAPAGFQNSLSVTKTSTGVSTYAFLVQYIEGLNAADLQFGTASAKTVTVSFWVKSSIAGNFAVSLTNSAENRTYAALYSINAVNTWEYKTVSIPGDTTGTWLKDTGKGVSLQFNYGQAAGVNAAGSWVGATNIAPSGCTSMGSTNGATFYLTGVQLEVGSSATGFEYRQYQQELALCQRYLPAFTGANGATIGSIGTGGFYSTTDAAIGIPFPVLTRVPPTGITVASASYFQIDGLASAACTSATFSNASQTMGGVNFGYATSTTAGSFGRLRFNNASGTLLFTGCEL